MEDVDIMPDGKYNTLQETLEEVVEDDDRVFEEEIVIPNEETERENVMHDQDNLLYEDEEENQVDAYMSDQDCDLDGNADDHDDDLSP
jgi:hypothetical protein